MSRVGTFLRQHWRVLVAGLSVMIVAYFVLFHGIISSVPNFSATEIATQGSATSLRSIWHDPVNAPFKLLIWLPFKLGHHSVLWARVAAGFVGVVTAALFYFVLTHLFSRRVALLASLLFVFSTGFLHTAHLGTPLIMQMFGVILLTASVPLYLRSRFKVAPLYIGVLALAALLYTPTMVWFIAIGAILMTKRVRGAWAPLPIKHKVLLPVLFLALITPLIWSIVREPLYGLTFLGLPQHLPSLQTMGSNLYSFVKSLVWYGTGPAEIMLVGAPILNVIEIGLIVAGLVALVRSFRLRSNLFVTGSVILFVVLVALGDVTYLPLMPFLFLLLASGIFYLLNEWFDVFPLNPVANVLGTGALCLLVGASVLFHIRAYYVAWPRSNETHAAFRYPQPTVYFPVSPDTKETVRF